MVDPTDQAGFEQWAPRQGLSLEKAGTRTRTRGGLPLPTYFEDQTEFAWRGWANRPHRTTRVSSADLWPTPTDAERKARLPSTFEPLPDDAYHGMPRFGEVPKRVCRSSPAFSAPYGVDEGKTLKDCKLRFPHPFPPVGEGPEIPVEGVARKSLGETWLQGVESLAAELENDPFREAVRKLVNRLPKVPYNLQHYVARDELLAVRRLLGVSNGE